MIKQKKHAKPSKGTSIISFIKRHKIWSVIAVLALVAITLTAIDYYHAYVAYKQRFTDKDFAAIESMAEQVLKDVGRTEVTEDKKCRYVRPEVYSSLHLYCSIEMVSYMDYKNDQHATSIAKILEQEVKKKGQLASSLSTFYSKPQDGYGVSVVNLAKPLPETQCNFYIDSNQNAKDAASFLPEKTEDNLIALRFYCSAESRKEYFPVTYRQG